MIAAIDDGKELHIVKWTGRKNLHAEAITYCNRKENAGDGVIQVPEAIFTQGAGFAIGPGQRRSACSQCRAAAQAMIA